MAISYTYTTGQILTAAELNASFTAINTTQAVGDNSTNAATTAFVQNGFLPLSGGSLTGSITLPNTNGIYQIGNPSNGFYADTNNLALRVANSTSAVFIQWVNPNTAVTQQIAVFGTGGILANVPTIFSSNLTTYGTFTSTALNSTTGSFNSLSVNTITLPGSNNNYQIGQVAAGLYADPNNLALRVANSTSAVFFQWLNNGVTTQMAVFGTTGFLMNVPLVVSANLSTTGTFTAPTMYTNTPSAGNNSTYVATTAFVQNAITIASGIPAGNTNVLLGCTGTAGSAAAITLGGGLSLYSNNLYFGNLTGTQWAGQGSYFSWNYSSGGGEMDLFCSHGGGAGGFNFYNVSSNATATPSLIASLNNVGALTANAVFYPTTRFAPATGSTLTIPTGTTTAYIQPAGTISTLTVALPSVPSFGTGYSAELDIFFINGVSTLTWSGTTVGASMPSVASAGTAVKLTYTPAVGAWAHYTLS